MTKEELAAQLDGGTYGHEIDDATERAAKESGCVRQMHGRPPMRILFLDDDESRFNALIGTPSAKIVSWARTAAMAIEILSIKSFDLIMLDHDLADEHYEECASGRTATDDTTTGYAVALWLCANPTRFRYTPMIVHSINAPAAARMLAKLDEAGFDVRHVPFGWLKV